MRHPVPEPLTHGVDPRPGLTSPEGRLAALEPDPTCGNRTNWRTRVRPLTTEASPAPEEAAARVESRLGPSGWQTRCRHPRLRVFRQGDGHEIAWVLTSGRVQIRVPWGVDEADRPAAAARVWRQLEHALSA